MASNMSDDDMINIHSDEESIYDGDYVIVNETAFSSISGGSPSENDISPWTRDSQATTWSSTETIDAATTQHDTPTNPPRSLLSNETTHFSPESPHSADATGAYNPCVDNVFAQPFMAGNQSTSSPKPVETPNLPTPYHHNRVGVLEKAIAILTSKASTNGSREEEDLSKALPLFLFGEDTVGKSGLASVVIRDPRIQQSFSKGIHWVTVGWRGTRESTRLHASLRLYTLLRKLADEVLTPADDQQAASPHRPVTVEEFIRRFALANASCEDDGKRLVVLDDVWEVEIIEAFHRAKFVLLVTTNEIDDEYTAMIKMLPVSWTYALDTTVLVLKETVPMEKRRETTFATSPTKKPRLKEHCDDVKLDTNYGCGAGGVSRALADGIDFIDKMDFKVSELDPATRECFFMLGVLAMGTIAPADMLSNLWNQGPHDTERTIARLVDRCLLEDAKFLLEDEPESHYFHVPSPVLAFTRRRLLLLNHPGSEDANEGNSRDGGGRGDGLTKSSPRPPCEALAMIATARQAEYLSRVDELLRYSGVGVVDDAPAKNYIREILWSLTSLAALWQSVEELSGVRPDAHRLDKGSQRTLLSGSTYGPSLKNMGTCAKAAYGLWAAAKLLVLAGRPNEAKSLAERSMFMGNSLYSACETLAVQLKADYMLRTSRGEEVDELHAQTMLDKVRKSQGPNHPAVAALTSTIAGCLVDQGYLAEADVRFHEAIGLLEGALGDDHPRLVPALIEMAELLREQPSRKFLIQVERKGLNNSCLQICTRALAILDTVEKMGIKGSQGTATSLVLLADIIVTQKGETRKAESLYRKALAILRSGIGAHPLQVGTVLIALADLIVRETREQRGQPPQGKKWNPIPEEPVKLYREAIFHGANLIGQEHEKIVAWRIKLVDLLSDQGKYIEVAAECLRVIFYSMEQPTIDQGRLLKVAHGELERMVILVDHDDLVSRVNEICSSDRPSASIEQQNVLQQQKQQASPPPSATTPNTVVAAQQAPLDNVATTATAADYDDAASASAYADAEDTTAAISMAAYTKDVVDYGSRDNTDASSYREEEDAMNVEGAVDNAVAGSSSDPMPDDTIVGSSPPAEEAQKQQHQQGGERRGKSENEKGDEEDGLQLQQEAIIASEDQQLVPSLNEAVMYLYANHRRSQPYPESALSPESDEEAKDLQHAISLSLQSEADEGY